MQLKKQERAEFTSERIEDCTILLNPGDLLGTYRTSPTYAFVDIIEERKTGKIYLGTWNQGLFEFDPKEKTFIQLKKKGEGAGSISSNNAYRVFQDSKDRIWVGTWGAGLNLFDL